MYDKSDKQNAWLKYKFSALKAAEEVCGVSKCRSQHGGTRMCKKPSKQKKSFRSWKQFSSAEYKSRYISDKKKPKRAVAEAMKKEAAKEMEEIRNGKNVVSRRIRMVKKEASDLAGNNCLREVKWEDFICRGWLEESVEGAYGGHHE